MNSKLMSCLCYPPRRTHVVVASEDSIYYWQYRTHSAVSSYDTTALALRRANARIKCFSVDDPQGGIAASDVYVASGLLRALVTRTTL